jgi:multidrug efflux pump subunit AcrA (membrane-fusion protein)
LTVNGTVQAVDLLEVTPQIGGLQIRQMLVRDGDSVAAGQAIATLDTATLEADIRQQQAQLAVAQAQVTQRRAAQVPGRRDPGRGSTKPFPTTISGRPGGHQPTGANPPAD